MKHRAGEFPSVPFIPSNEEKTVKTASDVQDTVKSNPNKPGSSAPSAKPQGGSWQFYFVIVAIVFGLMVLLGKALGLF
jgi:hypothetical protein